MPFARKLIIEMGGAGVGSHSASGAGDPAGIDVIELRSSDDLGRAREFVDTVENSLGVPMLDESESERLRLACDGHRPESHEWLALMAVRGGTVVGYAGVHFPNDDIDVAQADLVVDAEEDGSEHEIRSLLLAALSAAGSGRQRLLVWMRHVDERDLTNLENEGFHLARHLGVLGRDLAAPVEVRQLPGGELRGYHPGADDEQVVEVLARAYAGTEDGGWTLERLEQRKAMPWFRSQDLLIAEDADESLLGLVWIKRRSETVGEVYNLAVHPKAQGRGVGPALLAYSLQHLRASGFEQVILWVDRINERAVALYEDLGFVTQWNDVAIEHLTRQ